MATSKITDTSQESDSWKQWIRKNALLLTTLIGVVIGTFCGTFFRQFNLSTERILLISYPGELFIRMFKCIMLPLLISSIITVASDLGGRMNGKIMYRTLCYYICSSTLSAIIGICVAFAIKPGRSISASVAKGIQVTEANVLDNFLDLGRNLLPENLFQATFQQIHTVYTQPQLLANTTRESGLHLVRELAYRNAPNTLGLVVFCLVFGSAINSIGPKGQVVKAFFSALLDALLSITTKAMWLSGIGVCSIIAGKLLVIDDLQEIMTQLAYYMLTVLSGILIHQAVVMPLIYFAFVRRNPYKFLFSLSEPWVTAFAIASSTVTMPTTINCMVNKLHYDDRISKFVISLGVVLHNSGSAVFLAVASVFIARLNGDELQIDTLVTLVLVIAVSSTALPSIPSGSLVILVVILSSVDIDPSNVSLLFAVDWILDRCRTTSNVLDDCFATAVITKFTEKELDIVDTKATEAESEKMLQNVDSVV